MKSRTSIFMLAFATSASLFMAPATSSFAQTDVAASVAPSVNQSFFKKRYRIKGTWSLEQRDGKTFVKFSDDFKTKNGPDLKVFLSPKSADDVTGKTAVDGSINLGVLKSNKGTQEYEIPAGTDLNQFGTVLIHCEAYSVLWGGGVL